MDIIGLVLLVGVQAALWYLAFRQKKEPREGLPAPARERVETILRNIDRYDGTSAGQEDVPGGW